MARPYLGGGKKNVRRLKATLVFLDESGLLLAPLVRRTWALRGRPDTIRQRTRSTDKVSAIAALAVGPRRRRVHLYGSLLANRNVRTPQLLRFLRALLRHVRGPVILVWDRLNVHRAKAIARWAADHPRLQLILLPPYAPDLNPVELFWSYLKYHRLVNFAALSARHLSTVARRHTRVVSRSQAILRSFIRGTPLSSCLR